MLSGLEQERAASRRQPSVAWAWLKARGIMRSRANSTHAKLTASVLLTSDCGQAEEISSWRDSLAAFNHRSLARQICDQFFDVSILTQQRHSQAEGCATEWAGAAVPAYCAEEAKAELMRSEDGGRRSVRARILSAVLPEKRMQRGAVLIPIRTRAA